MPSAPTPRKSKPYSKRRAKSANRRSAQKLSPVVAVPILTQRNGYATMGLSQGYARHLNGVHHANAEPVQNRITNRISKIIKKSYTITPLNRFKNKTKNKPKNYR